MTRRDARRVLIIVQNLPVPLDRRVWLECQALTAAGFQVSVICPKGPLDPSRQVIDDIAIFKYRPAPQTHGVLSYLWEFAYCWIRTAWLSVVVRRQRGFDVIQACNPPDTYWLLAWLWRARGVRFVYDQHDLNPELFISRFGEPSGVAARAQYGVLCWLERMTYRVADHVISTNQSYKSVALQRGKRQPSTVTVVRSGPNTARMRPIYPPAACRAGAEHLLVYLGIMGPQDGVELVLLVMNELVHRRNRTGVRAALLGFGDCLDDLQRQAKQLNLDEYVTFTGRVGPEEIADYLSAADVGICPDPKTPMNDVSTMNKTMEYMAYCVPSVSYDLVETRVTAGDTALFVNSGDVIAFTDQVERLLDDDELRVQMGLAGRQRVASTLDWSEQANAYVAAYRAVLGVAEHSDSTGHRHLDDDYPTPIGAPGRITVPLDDPNELARFIRERPTLESLSDR